MRFTPIRAFSWLVYVIGLTAVGAGGAELGLEVLRAEAHGSALDVLLRIEAPEGVAEELGAGSFAVFIAPAELPPAEAAAERFRVRRIFLKRLGNAYYIDLRQLPPGISGRSLQLIVQAISDGRLIAACRLAAFLGPPPDALDVALVIDESLSMLRTDPEWLRLAAAKAFVDHARQSTRIGHIALVAFNDRSRTLVPLTPVSQPEPLYQAIQRISAMGQTDMDAALSEARKLLERSPSPNKVAILLSDGKDEPGVYDGAHRAWAERRWPVYTIGLSKLADAEVLQRIASDTGGDYHCSPTNAELREIFNKISVALHNKVAIRARTIRFEANAPAEDPLLVDDTISALTVSLGTAEQDVAFTLRDTANRLLTPDLPKEDRTAAYHRKADSQHYDLWGPAPGRCVARIAAPRAMEVRTSVSAATPLLLRAFPLKPAYLRGEAIEVAASLANGDDPVASARIEARMLYPGAAAWRTLPLYDDGQHHDTAAGDGVFATRLPGAEQAGKCLIHLAASGTTLAGHPFEREAYLTATIRPEGYHQLAATPQQLDFGLLYNGESASRTVKIELTSAIPSTTPETVSLSLAAATTNLPRVDNPREIVLTPAQPVEVPITLQVPPGQAAGRYSGTLEAAARFAKVSLPITVEVRRPKLVLDKPAVDLEAIESGATAEGILELRLEPRGVVPARLAASDQRLAVAPAAAEISQKPKSVRVSLASQPDQASEAVKAMLAIETPIGSVEAPVMARVVKPSLTVAPAAIDFGECNPGQAIERQLALSMDGLKPRRAEFALAPLAGPAGAPPLAIDPLDPIDLAPGKPAAVLLRLRVAQIQSPGAYRGELLVRTPLGERKVACSALVGAANTFAVAAAADFGSVAVGAAKELQVEVTSLVDAEQRVELAVAQPSSAVGPADWQLAAEPPTLVLPPRRKAAVTLRLAAAPSAKPGPRSALVDFRGPSHGASLEARALIFRPPHHSIALVPPELDLGRLKVGNTERFSVGVKSLVDEPQEVAIDKVDAPAELVALAAEPRRFVLNPHAEQAVELRADPAFGLDGAAFDATVTARGRSLPATLRIRGSVFTPPRMTFVLVEPVLDFGSMAPGERAELALAIQSAHHREQRVSLAEPPQADGITLSAERDGALLQPWAMDPIGIELVVAPDAAEGERRLAWEVRGPGDPATFEVRVEIVHPQAPASGTPIAIAKPGPLGWLEGALLFILLVLLLAILVATYLLARRLMRSTRMPRMARFFAVSALLHVAALFVTLDLFLAHKVHKQELGPLFRVGLKAAAGSSGGLLARKASAADELREQQERERRLDAQRRQQEAARLARELLDGERRKLDPTLARLDKPKAQERLDLAPRQPDAKRLTVEDLAQIMEELRDPTRAKEARQPEAQAPAQVEAERLAQLRALSREQLESVVRAALQPKAAEPKKTPAAPDVPGLAQARTADKAGIAPEELVPALEDLKQELTRAEGAGGASLPSIPVPGHAHAQHSTSGPAAERGTAPAMRSAERGVRSDPLAPAHSALATPHSTLAPPLSQPSAAGGPRHSAPIPEATPDEAVATVGRASQPHAVEGAGQPTPGAFAQAAPAPAGGEPSAQRDSVGGERLMVAEARSVATGRPAAATTATPPVPLAIPGPPAQRRPAPVSFPTPDEQPAADPLVQLPGTPESGDRAPQPRAVAIVRADASGGGGQRADTPVGGASVPSVPDARDPAHAPIGRVGRPVLPKLPSGGTAERTEKAPVPFSTDAELVEGPLVAVRREARRGGDEAGLQPAVATWHLRPRSPAGERLVMVAGVEAAGPVSPRAVAAERPIGGAATELARDTPAPARGEAPPAAAAPTDAALDEAVEVAPRAAMPGGRSGDVPGPATIEGGREAAAAQVERGAPSTGNQGARVQLEGPRASHYPVTRQASSVTLTAPWPLLSGGRQAASIEPDAAPDEPVEDGPRVAAREVGGGPESLSPGGAAPEPPRLSAAASRLPAPIVNQQSRIEDAAAVAALATAGRGLPSRLLLPGLATGGETAGAIVGGAAGAVKSIVLSTIKYGADWDCHRTAMPFLAWQLRERVGFNLETDVVDVPLGGSKMLSAPWVFMTGHKDFRLTEAEVANLRLYLVSGGTLWAEDCTHEDDPTWDRAFRREIARVLSPADGHKLRKITKEDDHPLFRACFNLSSGYKGYWPPPGDKFRQSYIEGIELAGRLAVIYTRNDYGCGLEIKPDTHPGKVSLSGLSPAEMQEASFLMASNIVVYALTHGRGVDDRGLAGRAAASLRRQREAAEAQGDPYDKARGVLFESFAEDNWLAESAWDGAGSATLRPLRRADPRAEGRRLAVNFQLAKDQAKVVLIRDLAGEADLSGHERCYVDVESRLEGGARLAIAFITMPDWRYFESRPAFIKPGRQRVWFDLRAPTWKTGEPVAEGESEYSRRPANLDAVRRCVILLYPVQAAGTVVLDQIEFRSLQP